MLNDGNWDDGIVVTVTPVSVSADKTISVVHESGLDAPVRFAGRGRFWPDTLWMTRRTTSYMKRWRHMDFFEYRTFLHAPSPRVTCPTCGIRRARIPWARPRSGFTRDLEGFVAAMAEDFPVTTVARILGEHDTRLGYILRHCLG